MGPVSTIFTIQGLNDKNTKDHKANKSRTTIMNTSDMSLKMFLEQYNIGTLQEIPDETLMDFGHSEHTAAETEILLYSNIKNEFDLSDTPSLAVNYLIKCGYSKVTTVLTRSNHSKAEVTSIACTGLENICGIQATLDRTYIVSATDAELPPIMIIVSFGDQIVSFTKVPGKQS